MMPLSFPHLARLCNCARTSRRAARVIDDKGWEDVLVFHYGWYFPELLRKADVNVRHIYECLDDHTAAPNIAGRRWTHDYIRRIENKMIELSRNKEQLIRTEVSKADALKNFTEKGDPYKVELIRDLEDGTISFASLFVREHRDVAL